VSNVAAEMAVKSARAHDVTDATARKRNWLFGSAVIWLVVVALVVILGEWLPFVSDPNAKDASKIKVGPSWEHWFGTGTFGQDVFSRVVVGGRISLFVGATVTAIGIFFGGLLGLLAGYLRGWVDSFVRLLINVTLSIPALLLVIFIVTISEQSLWSVVLAVSLLAIPSLARIVRASTLQVAERDFVKAAQVLGVARVTSAVPHLLELTSPDTEPDARVRAAAVFSLGRIADPAAKSAVQAAREDSDRFVRDAARVALRRL